MNIFGSALNYLGIRNSADPPPGWVPADATISQLLDYIGSGGDTNFLGMYGVGPFGIRNASVSFPTFFRAVTLLSSMIAQVLTSGSLRIMDIDGRVVKNATSRRILQLFAHSLDNETASFTWVEDWVIEYLIDGNALAEIARGPRGSLAGLRRLSSYDADIIRATNGDRVYRARYADEERSAGKAYFSDRNLVHVRWPRVIRPTGGKRAREAFAAAPVNLMRVALEIGLEGDRYVRDWYKAGGGAHRSNIGISMRQTLSPDHVEQFQKLFAQSTTSRAPLLMGGGASFTNLTQTASNKDQAQLRDFQVSELGRVYGIPGPILNQQVTQWGSGIEQLSKFFWRFGLRQHVERVLNALAFRVLTPGQRFGVDDADLLRGDADSVSKLLISTRGDAQTEEVATREERRIWAGLPLQPEHGELKDRPEPVSPSNDSNNVGDGNEGNE